MNQSPSSSRVPGYDANLLFDELLRRFNLENDEALSQCLGIGRGLVSRMRRGDMTMGATLLIRISEHCGIDVAELRRMAGDRRNEVRLEDVTEAARHVPAVHPGTHSAVRTKAGLVRDDPGLPANVQWT